MKYEYDFEQIPLSEQDQAKLELGMVDVNAINSIIKDIINTRGQEGWEALYPFSAPYIWFRKPVRSRQKKNDV